MVSTSRLVLVHTACALPWWGEAGGGVIYRYLLPITAHEFLSIYRIIDTYYRTTLVEISDLFLALSSEVATCPKENFTACY